MAATTDRPRGGPPRAATTFVAATALFLALLVLLVWQMRAGHDPALSAQRPAAVAAATPRRVLIRQVHRRVIEEKVLLIPAEDDAPAHAVRVYRTVPVSGGSYSPPPASSAPAPAPAPVAAAPAPAPAPAPAVTHTS